MFAYVILFICMCNQYLNKYVSGPRGGKLTKSHLLQIYPLQTLYIVVLQLNFPVCIVFIVVNNVLSSEYNALNKVSYTILI